MSVLRVDNHVHYVKANGRLQTARITAVDSVTVLDLRIGHHSTFLDAPKMAGLPRVSKWRKTA
jgi:hypothetical protein